jgi:hypothetical protein
MTIDPLWMLCGLFWASEIIVVSLVMAPVYRFVTVGWRIRKQEFTNRIFGRQIELYLHRFWSVTILRRKLQHMTQYKKFSKIYNMIAGRSLYVTPSIMLFATLVIFGGLAIETAIRFGYEQYVTTYLMVQKADGAKLVVDLDRLPLSKLNALFNPFPTIVLSFPALASIAGAYLSVVQTTIYGYKTRTLLSTDLLWASFRLIISIPLGLCLAPVPGVAGPAILGFALGAFPIKDVIRLLRRIIAGALKDEEAANNRDDLLQMIGVTPEVSARLNEEGIFAPQQLADVDPVSLAIRAGLAFDLVLNLSAQSVVWSYLGGTTGKLGPLGFADARAIRRLVGMVTRSDAPETKARGEATIAALAKAVDADPDGLRLVLQFISDDPFTGFLVGLDDGASTTEV